MARDFFDAPGKAAAENMVNQAEKRLHDYAETVYQKEAYIDMI